jgi:DNA-binding transcriptional ArsR family regulator
MMKKALGTPEMTIPRLAMLGERGRMRVAENSLIVNLRYTIKLERNSMATKNATYSDHLVELSNLARALAHPARIRILEILGREQSCLCGEIVDQVPLSQSTVSQHLLELKKAGLIQGEISGPRTCYCLDPEMLRRARHRFEALFSGIGCCASPASQGDTYEL